MPDDILTDRVQLRGDTMTIQYIRVQAAAAGYRWKDNPKLHDIGTICQSIARYGFIDWPKLDRHLESTADTAGALVYGNGRIEALAVMERDGWDVPAGVLVHVDSGEWYVPLFAGLDSADAEALALDHNTLTVAGGDLDDKAAWHLYDREALAAIGARLHAADRDALTLDGDGLDALHAYLSKRAGAEADDPGGDPERADELQTVWGVQPGDRWEVDAGDGRVHVIVCGDATERADYRTLLGDSAPAHMLLTDPPYGVDYTGGHFHSGNIHIKRERPRLDNDAIDIYAEFLPVVRDFFDGPGYVFYAGTRGYYIFSALHAGGYDIHSLIIWHKTNATYAAMGANYKQRHEVALYIKPPGATLRWCGATDEPSIWEIPRDAQNTLHPTQKPVALMKRAIENHDVRRVLDPFGGSGTTVMACHQTGRVGYMLEIDPGYCAVALQRMTDAGCIATRLNGD